MSEVAKEGGHFYLPSGEPYYTVPAKNGEPRQATIRDARLVGAYPGVTSIIDCASKPGLTAWMIEQNILASLTLPRIDGESNEELLKRIRADAKEQAKKARDKGTEIHGALERYLCGLPYDHAYDAHIQAAMDQLSLCGEQKWASEKSFAHELGYGGKVDLHTDRQSSCVPWLVDFKGIEFKDKAPTLWDEHYQQLAAYRRGMALDRARCGICFIDRNTAKAVLLEAEEEGLQRGLKMFDALLEYWWSKNETSTYRR